MESENSSMKINGDSENQHEVDLNDSLAMLDEELLDNSFVERDGDEIIVHQKRGDKESQPNGVSQGKGEKSSSIEVPQKQLVNTRDRPKRNVNSQYQK